MKADLANREPRMLEAWERDGLYHKIRGAAKGRPSFILTDGPPYANGIIHLGHAVNKILKDIVVKSRTLDGYDAPMCPAGIVMGCRSRCRSRKRMAASDRKSMPERFAPPAGNTRTNRS